MNLLALSIGVLLSSVPVSFATFVTPALNVPMPCQGQERTDSCNEAFRSCEKVESETDKELSQFFETKIKYLKEQQLDVSFTDTLDVTDPKGDKLADPVCELTEMQSPWRINELQQDCGESLKISTSAVIAKQIGNKKYGGRENAFMNGTWVAALRCYLAQVKNEVKERKIKVSLGCEGIAKDLIALTTRAKTPDENLVEVAGEKVKRFCAQEKLSNRDIELMNLCDEDSAKLFDRSIASTTAVRSCQLAKARKSLESAYSMLAACEVQERAQKAYQLTMTGVDSPYDKEVFKPISKQCIKEGKDEADDEWRKSKAKREFEKAATKCVHDDLPPRWLAFIKDYFPANGSCRVN